MHKEVTARTQQLTQIFNFNLKSSPVTLTLQEGTKIKVTAHCLAAGIYPKRKERVMGIAYASFPHPIYLPIKFQVTTFYNNGVCSGLNLLSV